MVKRQFKSQASSSRAALGLGFGAFVSGSKGTSLSYLTEPPNLSSISEANVVIAFKHLLKKDGTTKAKGLEDLITFAQGHPYEKDGGVEQPILEAWVALYPRVSVDNTRRVRELSHSLQYELLQSARKRMEKSIPSIVGAWLAGTYDRDRPVGKAANDGIKSFLDTEDKVISFWRRCQMQILAYVQEALQETPQTLSDERTVSPDDSLDKYNRVIGGSLSLVLNLLTIMDRGDFENHQEAYSNLLSNNKTLWSFVSSSDPAVRRTTAQLLIICLDKQEEMIGKDIKLISHAFIVEGLCGSQSNSALKLLEALVKLTSKFPQAWTTAYKDKIPPLSRLRSFTMKGSQGGAPEFWPMLCLLLMKLPPSTLPADLDGITDFLKTMRDGITGRGENRTNSSAAWTSYFEIAKNLGTGVLSFERFNQLLRNAVFPAFEQYVRPVAENSGWSMDMSSKTLAKAFSLFSISKIGETPQILRDEWQRLSDLIINRIILSRPEQLNEHENSETLIAEAHRWFGLQAEIIRCAAEDAPNGSSSVIDIMAGPCSSVIRSALAILVEGDGESCCAAVLLEAALRLTPDLVTATRGTLEAIISFFEDNLPKLIISLSSKYLAASLIAFHSIPGQNEVFKNMWDAAVAELLANPDSTKKLHAIHTLTSNYDVSRLAQRNSGVQDYLLRCMSRMMRGELQDFALFESSLIFDTFSEDTKDQLVKMILISFDSEPIGRDIALHMLHVICQRRPLLLQKEDTIHLRVMTRLLSLTESSDPDTKAMANALKSKLGNLNYPNSQSNRMQPPILSIIRENLETVAPQSLSVDTLVEQVDALSGDADDKNIVNLFPDTERWFEALHHILQKMPDPCLSIMEPKGLVGLVNSGSAALPFQLSTDINGYSVALRMGLFTSRLLKKISILQDLPLENRVAILHLLSLTLQIAKDALLLQEDTLWSSLVDPKIDIGVRDFVESSVTSIIELDLTESVKQDQLATTRRLLVRLIDASKGTSPTAFYSGRILSKVIGHSLSIFKWKDICSEEWLLSLDIFKTSTPNLISAVAILAGLHSALRESKIVNNLCNRLLSEITDSSPSSDRTLGLLIFLNATLSVYEPSDFPVTQNRRVFAVKQLLSWVNDGNSLSLPKAAGTCRCLQFLLPSIVDMYGAHWQAAIDFCLALWEEAGHSIHGKSMNEWLPVLYASLKLIETLSQQNQNEDLNEALDGSACRISTGLIQLLQLPRSKYIEPWCITDKLLWERVKWIPSCHVKDWLMLYPLLASDFRFVQLAAFDILNNIIPAAQEQGLIDILIKKKDAQLPEELLSLLLDAPTVLDFPDDSLTHFPSRIRRYLLAWLLVFALYPNAPYKARSDYNEILKSEHYISPLLDFLFDSLGHSSGQPLSMNRSRLGRQQIQSYDARVGEDLSDERNLEWLLIHLWYICLKYAPALAKNWWIDCKSRPARIVIESWTEKYFSPLLIEEALGEVTAWAENQESSVDDEKTLLVKVLKKSGEVYAGYEVDDMEMQIVIRLPANYPLEGVKVDGINRVAVSDEKWKSWLMITQGVITFSNGTIIDGLNIFRKNVTGALQGQTECAICYSIISSDKKMPDTRCQTCKHLFHSNCLYKWFANSNQNTCPLCRNAFNYISDAASRARRRGGPE